MQLEKSAVAFALVAPGAIVLAHGAAAVLGGVLNIDTRESARLLGWAAVAIAAMVYGAALLVGDASRWRWPIALGSGLVVGGAVALVAAVPGAGWVLVPALVLTATLVPIARRAVMLRLPNVWDGVGRRRPWIAAIWAVASLVVLAETARVGAYMSNLDMPGTTDWMLQRVADHDCMGGYVYAAELNRNEHPNVYDRSLYPLATPGVEARPAPGIPEGATSVRNLAPRVLDNFQYPPPFLLLPRAALAVSNDFLQLRTVWFSVQWLALAATAFALAIWVGGRAGTIMCLLIPIFMMSAPTSLGLQRGQFHPAAWALAIAAMLAFERRRDVLGGAMLSFAVLSKIFPGALGLYLIVTKRWSAVAWTFAAAAGWVLLSLLVLGEEPFERFLSYQLPRLTSGEAFSWCFDRLTCIINNQAPYGLSFKLAALGWVSDPGAIGAVVRSIYPFVVVGIVIWAGLHAPASASRNEDRLARARAWTSIAMLASLMPNLVPATYSPLGAFFTLMLLAGGIRSRLGALLLAIAWLAAFQLPASPVSEWKIGLSFGTALILLGVNAWTALTARAEPERA